MNDLEYLPPYHVNCRCVAAYSTKTVAKINVNFLSDLDNQYPMSSSIDDNILMNISNYAGNNSSSINYALESQGRGRYSKKDYSIGLNINNTIHNNGHKLLNNTTLWRGQDELYIKNPRIGKEFVWNRIISTSFSIEVGNDFKRDGWLIEILAPKNTKGLYIESISPNSLEYEYLLPINTKFKILSLDEINKYIKIQLLY